MYVRLALLGKLLQTRNDTGLEVYGVRLLNKFVKICAFFNFEMPLRATNVLPGVR